MFFKNVPTAKKANEIFNKIISSSSELKRIIINNCNEKGLNVNIEEIEYSTFLYDLFFYNQVMHIKYSDFFIESIINAILITCEENLNKNCNNIQKGYFQKIYKNLSHTLFEINKISKEQGINELYGVAGYYCNDELKLDEKSFQDDEILIELIANHFQKIINISESEI